MGLVMLGTASEKALDEMLQYAHETQHEKIIRGLAIGISFLMYGKGEDADGLIETLLGDAVSRKVLQPVERMLTTGTFRTPSFDTEESTPSPWPTSERPTTRPSGSSSTSPSRTSTTTFAAPPSRRSDSSSTATRCRSSASFSSSPRATTPTSGTELPSPSESRALVPVSM